MPSGNAGYGAAEFHLEVLDGKLNVLFLGVPATSSVWASHGDKLSSLPEGFEVIGRTSSAPFAAIAHKSKPIYGIQFHPEVTHTIEGPKILENFAVKICGARQNFTMHNFKDTEISRIRALVGEKGQVIGAV